MVGRDERYEQSANGGGYERIALVSGRGKRNPTYWRCDELRNTAGNVFKARLRIFVLDKKSIQKCLRPIDIMLGRIVTVSSAFPIGVALYIQDMPRPPRTVYVAMLCFGPPSGILDLFNWLADECESYNRATSGDGDVFCRPIPLVIRLLPWHWLAVIPQNRKIFKGKDKRPSLSRVV